MRGNIDALLRLARRALRLLKVRPGLQPRENIVERALSAGESLVVSLANRVQRDSSQLQRLVCAAKIFRERRDGAVDLIDALLIRIDAIIRRHKRRIGGRLLRARVIQRLLGGGDITIGLLNGDVRSIIRASDRRRNDCRCRRDDRAQRVPRKN